MEMVKVLFLCFILTSSVTGAFWSSSRAPRHEYEVLVKEGQHVVIEFEEESNRNTKMLISQKGDSGIGEIVDKCKHKLGNVFGKTKNVVSNEFFKFEEYAKEVVDEAAGIVGEPKEKLSAKIYEKVKSFGGKVIKDSEINDPGFTGLGAFFDKCKHKLVNAFSKGTNTFHDLEGHSKEVIDTIVGEVGDPKEKLSEKLSDKVQSLGGKVIEVAGKMYTAGKTIGMVSIGDTTEGTLKDSVVKIEEWDLVDSPKRIGEDIGQNASRKIEQGVNEVKETVETVKETSLNDLLKRSKKTIHDINFVFSVEKIKAMISWYHLLGFSTAYGMGIWVTFFSSCVLGKCLPKQQFGMVLNKMNMVYFRAMSYCVGAALLGYLVRHRKGMFSNNMEIFQGFNLLSALLMILVNLIFLEPQATKLIVERMKMHNDETDEIKRVAEKLKKLNTYSSTLNVSTMVVLTWHVAYIGQLIQDRH